MCRRPLPTAAVQLLLFCFFFALLPSQSNALTCGYGQRTESKVVEESYQKKCDSTYIACRLASCSSGEKAFFAWGCSLVISEEGSNCKSLVTADVTEDYPSEHEWTCNCTFGKLGESVDMAPPDLPSTTTTTTTTTTTKRSRSTKSGGGEKSGGGRLIVKTQLVLTLQMFIGFVPAMFVGLSGRTA
uniref:Uncharacterized protein n=1 Tax=Globodera rostochiensis TaxID=31243 RepID=A0A914HEI9_GLORO